MHRDRPAVAAQLTYAGLEGQFGGLAMGPVLVLSSVRRSSRAARVPLALLLAGTALAALLLPAPTASAVTYGKIVSSPTKTAPWALSLWLGPKAKGPSAFRCTATAIAPQVVVTAAHCVQEKGFYYVVVGASRLGKGRRVAVEALADHPGYRPSRFRADIAVLRPLLPLDLTTYAVPATAALAARAKAGREQSLRPF